MSRHTTVSKKHETEMTSPYKVERDYFDDLPEDALRWMRRYIRACEYGNTDTLFDLCEEAPTDQYERLKQEIDYERKYHMRNTPNVAHSRYSELDYGWTPTSSVSMRNAIKYDYSGEDLQDTHMSDRNSTTKRKKYK